MGALIDMPSGKHTKNYGKSPCYSWENSLFLRPCSIAMINYQRVSLVVNEGALHLEVGSGGKAWHLEA